MPKKIKYDKKNMAKKYILSEDGVYWLYIVD